MSQVLLFSGPKLNSFVCPHAQLEGVGTYLIFEMPNDHVGSCVAMIEVTPKNRHFILTLSKKAVLINMEGQFVSYALNTFYNLQEFFVLYVLILMQDLLSRAVYAGLQTYTTLLIKSTQAKIFTSVFL